MKHQVISMGGLSLDDPDFIYVHMMKAAVALEGRSDELVSLKIPNGNIDVWILPLWLIKFLGTMPLEEFRKAKRK